MIGRLILGLGSIAGGTLAAWRLTQEYAEYRELGPPAWWVVWRYPVEKYAEAPPLKMKNGEVCTHLAAFRVFRWNRDRWDPLTSHVYAAADASYLTPSAPEGRSLYAQVTWSRPIVDKPWTVKLVRYAANVKDKLPR